MQDLAEKLLNQVNEAVIICDTKSEITFINNSAKEILGDLIYGLNKVDGPAQDVLKYKEDGVTLFRYEELPIIRALNGESIKDLGMLIVYQNKIGSYLWCSINASPIYEDNKIVAATLTVRDLTERKKNQYNIKLLNGQLTQTNMLLNTKVKELEGFAARVAHDLKTPLAPISGFMDMLREEFIDDKDKVKMIDIILKSAESMSTLISELLEFSDITYNKENSQEINLQEVFNEIIDLVNASLYQSNGKINIAKMPNVRCNKNPIKHLFNNLISNSIKYCKEDENLVIDITYNPPKQGQNYATLKIKDNGIGFKQEEANLIFEPMARLQTNKSKGHGLGLAISAKAAENEGWSISATSNPNEGATFLVKIPKERILKK